MVNHTYEAKIRLDGKVTTTQVQASDAGHAKKLVQAQYGAQSDRVEREAGGLIVLVPEP